MRGRVPGSPGAAWGPDDTIVLAAGTDGLMQVSAIGGTPATPLTSRDEASGEATHHSPQFLPGGRELLFAVRTVTGETHPAVLTLATGTWEWIDGLARISGAARFVETGHLVYPESSETGQLVSVSVDLEARNYFC